MALQQWYIVWIVEMNSRINQICGDILFHITRSTLNPQVKLNLTYDARYEKTDLKVFVIVIPKEGWACMAAPSFFWYDNDKDLKICFLVTRVIQTGLEIFVVFIPKEGLTGQLAQPPFGMTPTMKYNLWGQQSTILYSVSYEKKAQMHGCQPSLLLVWEWLTMTKILEPSVITSRVGPVCVCVCVCLCALSLLNRLTYWQKNWHGVRRSRS